jgi:hypothetical protein
MPMRFGHKGWMVFDQAGRLIEEGDLGADTKVDLQTKRSYQANGEVESSEIIDGDKITHYRMEKSTEPDGTITTRTFRNDELRAISVSKANSSGTIAEVTVTDGQGKTISSTRSQRDAATHTVESSGQDGAFVIHSRRRVDDQGNTVENSLYDDSGKLISTLSFNRGELTSFWQDPQCQCTNAAGFRNQGTTIFYKTQKDGALFKEVQHHPGRPTNHEIDGHELYDRDGNLLEKITYTYERDSHGNWTKRTVSVLDLNTNTMVAVQEDDRELTYY